MECIYRYTRLLQFLFFMYYVVFIFQGTFSVYEKFSEIIEFVQENLEHDCPFILSSPTGHKYEDADSDSTLMQLRLVPATILTFQWDPSIAEEITSVTATYLKPDVMMLIQSM